jgi:hypothetical protein
MTNCTVIFSRHCGLGNHGAKPTRFVAEALEPLLEERAGKRIHVIHELVPTIPQTPDLVKNFEKLLGVNRFMRDLKQFDKGWRLDVKTSLSKMDLGRECDLVSMFPEARVIIDANRKTPSSVVNHLAFYPLDSVVEASRFKINMLLAKEKAGKDKLEEAVGHVMEAQEALAASNLHADIELMKQLSMIGEEAVVLRSMNHAYLVNLDRYDIPVVEGPIVLGFADLVRKRGIGIYPKVEETPLTFGERAINTICSGGIDKERHRELTLLEIFFASHMATEGLWDSPDGIDQGLRAAAGQYDQSFNRGKEARDPPMAQA